MAKILVVEDEESVRKATVREMQRAGHEVFEASDPFEAMLRVMAVHGLPNVVISDHRMPGMNGLDFLRELAEYQPEVGRILYTGGSTQRGETELFAETPRGTVCFSKPTRMAEILQAVEALFNGDPSPTGFTKV